MEIYGQNIGAVQIVAAEYKTSGKRNVFVQDNSNPMDYVPLGGAFKPMFNAGEKAFQGDLCEFSLDNQTIMVFRTFKVVAAVTAESTTIKVQGGAYRHIPHAGMNLMKAPSTLTGTGTAGAIANVVAKDDATLGHIYELTITAGALGTLSVGDILVEAVEAGSSKKMLVSNPNTFIKNDIVFNYPMNVAADPAVNGAIMTYAPVQHAKLYKAKMQDLPACVAAINKSRIDGLFEL